MKSPNEQLKKDEQVKQWITNYVQKHKTKSNEEYEEFLKA